jgi:adenine-specific DNA-methyltransferase
MDRPGLFYPIFIDPEHKVIKVVGEPLPKEMLPDLSEASKGTVAWPIRRDGTLGNWQVKPSTLRSLIELGYVRLGGFDRKRQTWTVQYVNRGTRARIEKGEIVIVGKNSISGHVELAYSSSTARQRSIKTVWNRGLHDSGIYGSSVLRSVLGEGTTFPFPKSIYTVRDTLLALVRNKPNAIILDFFAGSGTTFHALSLINAIDGGARRCILVTNNEVSEEARKQLRKTQKKEGDADWDNQGICRAVTRSGPE